MNNWRKVARVIAAVCAVSGCVVDQNHDGQRTVACVGDSNTMPRWPGPDPVAGQRWCEQLAAAHPGYTYRNLGMVGASVTGGWAPIAGYDGPEQFATLTMTAPAPDAVVAAFLTNDVRTWGASPASVVARLQAWQVALGPVPLWVLLAPPAEPAHQAAIDAMNAAVVAAFPGRTIAVVYQPGDYLPDSVHLNAAGHVRRATAVATALLL